MRMALAAGWSRADLVWERLTEAGFAAFDTGDLADDTAALFDVLEIERADVVGAFMGESGRTALVIVTPAAAELDSRAGIALLERLVPMLPPPTAAPACSKPPPQSSPHLPPATKTAARP